MKKSKNNKFNYENEVKSLLHKLIDDFNSEYKSGEELIDGVADYAKRIVKIMQNESKK